MRLNPTKVKITAAKKIENFVLNLIYISFIIIFQSHLYIRKKPKKSCIVFGKKNWHINKHHN
jgi:hypothetical protein